MLTEDVEWRVAETVPAKPQQGRRVVSSVVSGRGRVQMFDMDTFKLTVHRKLVDGDTAVVRQAISARTNEGKQYDNEYCWIYTCRGTGRSPASRSTSTPGRRPRSSAGRRRRPEQRWSSCPPA